MASTTGFKARVEYEVTNGTQTTYTFPFSYLRKKFVMVSILHSDGTETALEYGVDYTINDLSVSLTTPAQVGEHLIIYRQTTTDRIITWNDGSILLARDMNTEDAQMLHLQEEQQDYITSRAISTKVTSDKEVLWDALNHRISNVSDPKDPQDAVTKHYMENVQGGFVAANTILVQEATKQASAAKTSATQASDSERASLASANLAEAWATSTTSPDNIADAESATGKTQSSRSWALFSKSKAQEASTSATNAHASETKAKTSETNALASELHAKRSEQNAKTSETNAKTSETNAKTSETNASDSEMSARASEINARTSATNAANSAKQAAESAGVFQDFTGATATTDGTGGKVPKPLAGQQNKVLKADGTWGDGVTPKTLWDGMHSYPVNYVPADLSNVGWNQLGFCSIYYTQNKINNQPTQYGQLINIPADANNESAQLWIEQSDGTIFSRGGNGNIRVDDTAFKRFATLADVGEAEKVNSQGNNWIRYNSGLQICWVTSIYTNRVWSFPVAFLTTPALQISPIDSDYNVSMRAGNNTSVHLVGRTSDDDDKEVSVSAIGRWK